MAGAGYLFIKTRITDVRRLREGAGEVHVALAEELPAAPAESVRTPVKL